MGRSQFGKITAEIKYKKHTISTVESYFQRVFVVDSDFSRAYWSMAEAKRSITGGAALFFPVDVRSWFKEGEI